jgi:hypothetical protein
MDYVLKLPWVDPFFLAHVATVKVRVTSTGNLTVSGVSQLYIGIPSSGCPT